LALSEKGIILTNKNIAIELVGISKKYILHHEKPTLIESIISDTKNEEFWALRNINLKIMKGEKVGIIGPNGSGKTTLLKVSAGITSPTKGKVKISGKIVSLIELEAGFHPELTGIENIYLNGMLVGMYKKEIDNKLNEIVEFSIGYLCGDWDPHWYKYGPLYSYLLAVIYYVCSLFAEGSLEDYIKDIFISPSRFYLIGRVVNVILNLLISTIRRIWEVRTLILFSVPLFLT